MKDRDLAVKTRKKKFRIDLCNYDVIVIYAVDVEAAREGVLQYLKIDKPNPGECDACHITNSGGWSWIILPHNGSAPTAVHEISHCTDAVMKFCGFKDREVRAHIAGYLAKQIL